MVKINKSLSLAHISDRNLLAATFDSTPKDGTNPLVSPFRQLRHFAWLIVRLPHSTRLTCKTKQSTETSRSETFFSRGGVASIIASPAFLLWLQTKLPFFVINLRLKLTIYNSIRVSTRCDDYLLSRPSINITAI